MTTQRTFNDTPSSNSTMESNTHTGNDTSSSSSQHDRNEPLGTRRQVSGAAVAGGVAGLVLAGPIVGLIAAGGAVAVATSRSKAGQAARASGDVVADAGVRLQKYDEKNRVVEKTSQGFVKGCHWITGKINGASRKKKSEHHQAGLVA